MSNAPLNDNPQLKSKSLQPKIGSSTYVVNNSLNCSIRPKRASFDIKLYLQLHRKFVRKAIIDRKFEESVFDVKDQMGGVRKGFKGKTRPQSFLCRSSSVRQKEKRLSTEPSLRPQQTTSQWDTTHRQNIASRQGDYREIAQVSNTFHSRPNMMYNLSLYRKGFKNNIKRQKMCLTIMESFQKTRRQMTGEGRRNKALATVC